MNTFPHSHKAAYAKSLRKLSGDRKSLSYTQIFLPLPSTFLSDI